jgi:N-acetyl-anhydromuramyl-L-alanine amidase AmpD
MYIDENGIIDHERVIVKIFPNIEREKLKGINGIIVHQTDGTTASSTFNSYSRKGANGAHFLIDRGGEIYQTASIYNRANHVGILKSRCLATQVCSPTEFKIVSRMETQYHHLSSREYRKSFPERYPGNFDSIGIEIVGRMDRETNIYENVNDNQNSSLKWLIKELYTTLKISPSEIYRHPVLSPKMPTEAETAKWD